MTSDAASLNDKYNRRSRARKANRRHYCPTCPRRHQGGGTARSGPSSGGLPGLSASVSPLGPPEGVAEAISAVDLTAYPDPHCLALAEAIAAHHAVDGVGVNNVIVGNGSTEIIHLLTRAYIEQASGASSKAALLLTPTYGEYDGPCESQAEMCKPWSPTGVVTVSRGIWAQWPN